MKVTDGAIVKLFIRLPAAFCTTKEKYSFIVSIMLFIDLASSAVMSTAKRLVLSLRGRKESQSTAGTSSTRLVSALSSSPGHELDEIAVVSGSGDSCHALSYGSLIHPNGPTYSSGTVIIYKEAFRN